MEAVVRAENPAPLSFLNVDQQYVVFLCLFVGLAQMHPQRQVRLPDRQLADELLRMGIASDRGKRSNFRRRATAEGHLLMLDQNRSVYLVTHPLADGGAPT
jgi:hypothetical protein